VVIVSTLYVSDRSFRLMRLVILSHEERVGW